MGIPYCKVSLRYDENESGWTSVLLLKLVFCMERGDARFSISVGDKFCYSPCIHPSPRDWNGNKLFLVSRFLHSVQQPNSYVYHQHVDLNTVYKEIHNVNILHPQMIDQIHPIMKGAVRSWTTPQRRIQRSQPEELMIEPIMVPTPTINRPKRHNQGKCSWRSEE